MASQTPRTSTLASGLEIACWDCAKAKAVVHILHGMGEHKLRYGEFASFLNEQGFQVYAHDHRGHGSQINHECPPGHFGDRDGFKKVLDDVHQVQHHIHTQHPSLPLFLLGHSMGSFIAQDYLGHYPCQLEGLILSGSARTPRPLVHALKWVAKLECLRLGKRSTSKLINTLSFGSYNNAFKPIRTEFDWLSRDPQQVDRYIADPLCGFICSNEGWNQLAQALLRISSPTGLSKIPASLPCLIISGDKDPVGGNGKFVKALYQAWLDSGHHQVTLSLLPDARHEVLNESDRQNTYTALLEWMGKYTTQQDKHQGDSA